MITKEKLEIYQKYSGNIDRWAMFGKKNEHKIMTDTDWSKIDFFIQKIEMIGKGLVSKSYESETLEELEKACDSIETQEILKKLTH